MVSLIPNQLVKLYKTETFNERNKRFHQDYRTYCQIVKQEQTTMFQVAVSPEGNNLLTNGEFESSLSGWTIGSTSIWQWSAGQAQGIINSTTATLLQSVILSANTLYALTVDINLFVGSQSAFLTLASESGVVHAVKIERSDYGATPGMVTLYFSSEGYTFHVVSLSLTGDSGDLVYVNSVTLYKLPEPTVTLETCEGDFVKTIPALAKGNGRITYAVEWFGLDDGCYRVCVTDTEDTESNHLANALALSTEGDQPIELEDGSGFLKWFG